MTQLELLKLLLDTPDVNDAVLEFCLDNAKDIICKIRNTTDVETIYYNMQIKIAIEIFNKMGAEGEIVHNENGIARSYETGSISNSLLNQIIPVPTTPYSTETVI